MKAALLLVMKRRVAVVSAAATDLAG